MGRLRRSKQTDLLRRSPQRDGAAARMACRPTRRSVATASTGDHMFRNVHVGVDGGPTGRDAIRLATALAERGARLALVHIHGSELAPDDAPDLAFGATEPRDARKLLEAERDAARIDAELINGCAPSVGRGLRALAEKHAVDLLVVGSHPRGAASLLGDDTRAALNGAPCAVPIAPRANTARSE